MPKLHIIEIDQARISKISFGYRFKIAILDLGIYIEGFTARPSKKPGEKWWIQPPAQKLPNGSWMNPVEFDTTSLLWNEINSEAQDVLTRFDSQELNNNSDVLLTPDEEAKIL